MTEISIAFHELATVFEALETAESDAELTSVSPSEDNVLRQNVVTANARMRIPFLRVDATDNSTEMTAQAVSLTDDGALEVDLKLTTTAEAQACVSEPRENIHSAATNETSAEGEEAENTQTDSESSPNTARETENEKQAARPAYRDPAQLEAVYETHKTFQEMTDALEVDVTPQTVRRYMIKHGIHTPSSTTRQRAATTLRKMDAEDVFEGEGPETRLRNGADRSDEGETNGESDTPAKAQHNETLQATAEPQLASNADQPPEQGNSTTSDTGQPSTGGESNREEAAETEQNQQNSSTNKVSDGEQTTDDMPSTDHSHSQRDDPDVDLPDHLTLEQVKTTVQNAKTLYEVQQDLEMDRGQTQTLLQELNLLDLVHGRLSTRGLQERTIEEINRRIQTDKSRLAIPPTTSPG